MESQVGVFSGSTVVENADGPGVAIATPYAMPTVNTSAHQDGSAAKESDLERQDVGASIFEQCTVDQAVYDAEFEETLPNMPRVTIEVASDMSDVWTSSSSVVSNIVETKDYDSEFEQTIPNLPKVTDAMRPDTGSSASLAHQGIVGAPQQGGNRVTPGMSNGAMQIDKDDGVLALTRHDDHETPWKSRSQTAARRRALALVASFTGLVGLSAAGGLTASADPLTAQTGGSLAPSVVPIIIIVAVVVVAGLAVLGVLLFRRRKADADEVQPGDGGTNPGDGEAGPDDGGPQPSEGEFDPSDRGEEAESSDGVTRLGDGEVDPGGGEAVGPGDGSQEPLPA